MEIASTGLNLEFLGHSGFLIESKEGKTIAIDPYNLSDNASKKKADLILITHDHYDHCSIKDIVKLSKAGTIIVVPADAQSKITRVEGVEMQIIEIGDKLEFGGIKVEALPAYNIESDFHPKRDGCMGFLIKIGTCAIYHSGDTDKIPEMERLTGHGKHGSEFVALLPVSGQVTMDAEQAVEVASLLSPDLVIPMHYGAGVAGSLEDAQRFVSTCKDLGLKAEILERI